MNLLKQSTASTVLVFLVGSADHITGLASATLTITASKAGAAFASITPTVTDLGSGWYSLALTTTHTNTLGALALHITAASADPIDVLFQVIAINLEDAVRLGITALPNAAAEAAGGLYTRGTGAGQINQAANGQIDGNLVAWRGSTPQALAGSFSNEVPARVISYASGQAPLQPTTAGRTLDVTATGAAGIDLANVENQSTTLALSGTTIKTATDVETDTQDLQARLPAALGANGNIKADVRDHLGTAAASPTVAGIPKVEDATLQGRLTSTRAGYLDNLSAGAVATAAALTAAPAAVLAALQAWTHWGTRTFEGLMYRLESYVAGKATGLNGTNPQYMGPDGTTPAIDATQDPDAGTRSAVDVLQGVP